MAFVRATLSIEGVTDPLPPPVVVNAALTLRLAFANAGGAPVAVSGAALLISRPDGVDLAVPAGTMDASGTGVWLYTLLLDQGGQWRFRAACDDAATPDLPVTVTGSALSPALPTGPILVDETGLPLVLPEGGLLTMVRADRTPAATSLPGLKLVGVQNEQARHITGESLQAAAGEAGAATGATEGAVSGAAAGTTAGAAAGAAVAGQTALDAIAPQVETISNRVQQTGADVISTADNRQAVATDRTAVAQATAAASVSAAGAATARTAAETAQGQASASATSASLSAAVAVAAAQLYPDTTTGLAAVAEGAYFSVPGTGGTYAILYRKVSAAAVEIGRYTSKTALDDAVTGLTGVNDSLAAKTSFFSIFPPPGGDEWVGKLAGDQVLFGVNVADDNRFVGKNIQALSAAQFPVVPDYLGNGDRHYRVNSLGQKVGYTDANGLQWTWSGTAYVPVASGLLSVNGDTGPNVTVSAVDTASGFGICHDYLGQGYRHYRFNAAGQLFSYTDASGKQYAWDGTAYTAAVRATANDVGLGAVLNMGVYNSPVSWLAKQAIAKAVSDALKLMGYSAPAILPTPTPVEASRPPLLSTDSATYGRYVSQQIPSIARTGRWLWRFNYGSNTVAPGERGEGAPCYVTGARTNLDASDRLLNWTKTHFWVPQFSTDGILDPHGAVTIDGKLVLVVPSTAGGRRTAWGTVCTNPTAANPADLHWGPLCFLGYGFVGRPRLFGGELRMSINEPIPSTGAVFDYQKSTFVRLIVAGDVVQAQTISTIPGAVDPTTNLFQEGSAVPFGRNGVMAVFRTTAGYMKVLSGDDGRNWGTPVLFQPGGRGTISSRSDLVRSPSGRLMFAFNNSPPGGARARMSITASDADGNDGWPYFHEFDPRGAVEPRVSYPSLEFDAYPDETYNGTFWQAYDYGRGLAIDPATGDWANGLVIAEMNEDLLVAGTPSATLYQVGL